MKATTFKRSTKVSLKFANKNKQEFIRNLVIEYNRLLNVFIEYFWTLNLSELPRYCDSKTYKIFPSTLSAYLRQSCGKQALGIVKGTFQKQKQRIFIYEKLLKEDKIKEAKKLKRIIDSQNISIPKLDRLIPIEIGGNPSVIKVNINKENSFDGWIWLSNTKEKLNIPFRRTQHFNKLLEMDGKIAKGCRISTNNVTFSFNFTKEEKINGETLGVDIGSLNVLSCSNGFQSKPGLNEIQKKLARRKKGSKRFQKTVAERKNFINWSINQLNLDNVKFIKRENIKNLRKGVRHSRFLQAWTYTDIFEKLDRYCEEQNVSVIKISPTYTSQRCSVCGWTRKTNRKGKVFKCDHCGNTMDSDLNAAKNISFNLQEIGKQDRLEQKNRIGFYWNVSELGAYSL